MLSEGAKSMKSKTILVAAFLALVAVLGVSGYAFAQTPTPPNGYPGMMGGRGGMMGAYGSHGLMHEYMVKALAEKLGLNVDDLQGRIDAGENMWAIARSEGLTEAEISTLMSEAHDQALAEAVAAGVITQEQADWMDSHMEQMFSSGGAGGCHGGAGGGMMRRGSNL
jgi:hypothetical protein